jgi:hypothetical protein
MTFSEAKEILDRHNKWRRDNHVPNQYEMVNPTELGIAIETAIEALSGCIGSGCESYNDVVSDYRELRHLQRIANFDD